MLDIDTIDNKYDKIFLIASFHHLLTFDLRKKFLESNGLKKLSLVTYHTKYDEDNNKMGISIFELNKEESKGTRKFFQMSAPILNTLREGKILIIDELDASLHPMLTKHLIRLFHDEKVNKHNAQLIFATHDSQTNENRLSHKIQTHFTRTHLGWKQTTYRTRKRKKGYSYW